MNDELKVRCLALAHGGTMINEVIEGDIQHIGKKAFVSGLAPGETAIISIKEDKRSFINGNLLRIVESSRSRIAPPCPVFGECGGCDLQYLPITEQRELKRSMFESTLQRQAKLTLPHAVKLFGAELPEYGYRRRINLHVSGDGKLGFFREGSGEVVSFQKCLITSTTINDLIAKLAPRAREHAEIIGGIIIEEFKGKAVPIFLLRNECDHLTLAESLRSYFPLGRIYVRDKLLIDWHENLSAADALEFSTLSHFSQINPLGNQLLIEKVSEYLKESAEVTEFYAGSGNFSFPLAKAGKKVSAVEVDGKLVERGTDRARSEKLPQLKFIEASTERYIDNFAGDILSSVLLDPPRSGAKALCETLSPEFVKTIVYVSCALPTLGRDLAALVKRGYMIKDIGIIDMFPQTHHVESVTLLEAAPSTGIV